MGNFTDLAAHNFISTDGLLWYSMHLSPFIVFLSPFFKSKIYSLTIYGISGAHLKTQVSAEHGLQTYKC